MIVPNVARFNDPIKAYRYIIKHPELFRTNNNFVVKFQYYRSIEGFIWSSGQYSLKSISLFLKQNLIDIFCGDVVELVIYNDIHNLNKYIA